LPTGAKIIIAVWGVVFLLLLIVELAYAMGEEQVILYAAISMNILVIINGACTVVYPLVQTQEVLMRRQNPNEKWESSFFIRDEVGQS